MTLSPSQRAELHDLVDAVCESGLTAAALERLEPLLLADDDACRYYLDYVRMHGALMLATEQPAAGDDGRGTGGLPALDAAGGQCLAVSELPTVQHLPFVIQPSPTLSSPLSSLSLVLSSYLVSALVVGAILLIGAFTYVSRPVHVASQNLPLSRPTFGRCPERGRG